MSELWVTFFNSTEEVFYVHFTLTHRDANEEKKKVKSVPHTHPLFVGFISRLRSVVFNKKKG